MSRIKGRHIVITGASFGIGAELARQLAKQQTKLVLSARSSDALAQLADEVREAGSEASTFTCDVTDREQVFALAEFARTAYGEVDVWVSNAGRGTRHRMLEAMEEDMRELYDLNCLSALRAYQALIPEWLMRDDRGSGRQIIDVCSLGGKSGYAYNGGYAAAKHGMSAIADALRLEINGSGIVITTVYPGRTVSNFPDAAVDRTGGDKSTRTLRIEKSGNPIARAAASAQSTQAVARSIVRAIERRHLRVYPHKWGLIATAVYNFWPGLALHLAQKPKI